MKRKETPKKDVFFPLTQPDGMMRNTAALLVAGLALFCCCTGALEVRIRTLDDFEQFVNKGKWDLDITLEDDINFSQSGISFPLGSTDGKECAKYTGTFNGQNHTIKGINASNSDGYAGLFCSLGNAVFKDLVIDESCVFSGSKAGSLSAELRGNITVKNVVSRAKVDGQSYAGGFIAQVMVQKDPMVRFENCTREGLTVSSKYAGGFVGNLKGVEGSSTISILDSRSNGEIMANEAVGGFVGEIDDHKMTFNIWRCTSTCFINATNPNNDKIENKPFGGFLGLVNLHRGTFLFIMDSTRNGTIESASTKTVAYIGGLIGTLVGKQEQSMVHIQNIVSDGFIESHGGYSAGFIGNVDIDQTKIVCLKNCFSKTKIVSTDFVAGFAYSTNGYVNLDSCVSKGYLEGKEVYGIAPYVGKIIKVVFFGKLNETSGTGSQNWKGTRGFVDKNQFYGTNENYDCKPICVTVDDTGVYYGKEDEKKLLNTVLTPQDGVGWTNYLELVYLVNVSVGSPCNNETIVMPGTTLAEIPDTFCPTLNSFTVLNQSTWEKIDSATPFNSDTRLALCHTVTTSGAMEAQLFVEDNETLGSSSALQPFFTSEFIVRDAKTTAVVYKSNSVVSHNMTLVISRASQVVTVIDPEGNELDDETIRKETESLIEGSGGTVGDITVIREEDGLIYVTVVVPEEQTEIIVERLAECMKS